MDEKIVFCKGGGCTAKLGAGILERVLDRLPRGPADRNLLVGFDSRDYIYRKNLSILFLYKAHLIEVSRLGEFLLTGLTLYFKYFCSL